MMPASYTMETLPTPDDPNIKLRQVPARRVAAVRYSGFWSEEKYLLNKEKLEKWAALPLPVNRSGPVITHLLH